MAAVKTGPGSSPGTGSTSTAASTSGKGGKAAKSGATASSAGSNKKGSLCDSSGSGEAELANASPTPSYNEGVFNPGAQILSTDAHTLSFTYFDEAGFVATIWNPATGKAVPIAGAPTASNKALGTVSAGVGSITGPFGSAPQATQYDVGAPLVGHFSVTPATSAGTKSGVPVSGTVPPLATAIGSQPAAGYYAISITLADSDDSTPAPCSMQWVEHVLGPSVTPPPTPPVVPPNVTPPPTVQITKLNNAAGTGYGTSETVARGATSVPYRVTVTNPNASPGTLTVLTDTIDGVTTNICPTLIGTVLAPSGQANDSVTCDFTGPVPSTPTVDTAGTTLSVNGVLVSATAQSTVFPPVLGTQIVPPPSGPAAAPLATPPPAALAFTGAPVGRMLAAAMGMIALGLALLGALQLAEGERFSWSGVVPGLVARLARADLGTEAEGWSGAAGRPGAGRSTGPPGGGQWLIAYLQAGWTRLRRPGTASEQRADRPGRGPGTTAGAGSGLWSRFRAP